MKDWLIVRLIGLCETPLDHKPGDLSIRFNDEDITVKALEWLNKEFEEQSKGYEDEGINAAMEAYARHRERLEKSQEFLDDFYEQGLALKRRRDMLKK